jgi:hypothetical protein
MTEVIVNKALLGTFDGSFRVHDECNSVVRGPFFGRDLRREGSMNRRATREKCRIS